MLAWLTGGGSAATQPEVPAGEQDGRGERLVTEATPAKPWAETFNPIAAEQVKALRNDEAVAAELRGAKMQVVYRTWTDIKRAKGSSLGPNITDGQFFAIAPSAERASEDYKSLPSDQYVCFPAVRPPNFTDEVDIEKPLDVSFKAKNRDGETETVTLADFLKRIGHFISDLPLEADWSDDADAGPIQAASQFSVLPMPHDRTEIGVAMFGYQCKNLHIIVCPDGTLGWAPEGRGSKRIFLRNPSNHGELRAVALVPEDRTEVQAGFFKPEEPDETIEQEAERYKEVENQLLHIQIEMDLPRAHKPAALSGFGGGASYLDFEACDSIDFEACDSIDFEACDSLSYEPMCVAKAAAPTSGFSSWGLGSSSSKKAKRKRKSKHKKEKKGTTHAGMSAANEVQWEMAAANTLMAAPTAVSMASAAAAPPQSPTAALEAATEAEVVAELVEADESACVEADLNLARVQLGSVIGTSAADDAVPEGAKRAAGVSVRLTRMGYGVASDGAITAPRVRRFIKQMSFDRRARSLAHGSLVTGQGTWGNSSQTAPISLPPLPSTIDALAELFVQFPTKDVQKFVTGGPDAALQLAVGEEMSVPGLFTLKNIGGTIVATRAAAASG